MVSRCTSWHDRASRLRVKPVPVPSPAGIVPRLLDEANSIAQSCFPEVKRVTRSGPAPDHKPSILQDYELGRAMEIDVLVRAPAAFARAAGLSTPMLDMLAALAIQRAPVAARIGAAELGEGCVGVQSMGVVASGGEELCGHVGADAGQSVEGLRSRGVQVDGPGS